ncbi:MAG: YhbY family RNA-binding protein [Promethearchaeota archaeon]
MISKKDFNRILLAQPHCIMGKNGLSEEFISHVSKLLKRYKIIKIKALKNIANRNNIKSLANELAKKTQSYLLDVRGKKIIISKYPLEK